MTMRITRGNADHCGTSELCGSPAEGARWVGNPPPTHRQIGIAGCNHPCTQAASLDEGPLSGRAKSDLRPVWKRLTACVTKCTYPLRVMAWYAC